MSQCPRGNERNNTHNSLVLHYSHMFRDAGYITRVEPRFEFTHIHGTALRPDLTIYDYKGWKTCLDVSVTHPLAILDPKSQAVPEAEWAAHKREQEKDRKYKPLAEAANMAFYPIVHEALGRTIFSSERA